MTATAINAVPATPAPSPATGADADLATTALPLSRWGRWWFAPESPLNLGICRVLFFGAEFLYHLPVRFDAWGGVPGALFRPVWIFERLHVSVLPTTALLVVEIIWKLSLLLACIGLLTRAATAVAAVGALYLIGVTFSFGKVFHVGSIIVFTMGILAFSRSGDGLSVDALLRRRRGLPPAAPSGEYRWPVRMVWVLVSVLFFNAGMAKVIRGGLDWVTSENMAVLMTQRHYMNADSLPALNWGLFVSQHRPLYVLFAAASVLAEVFCFLALFVRYPWRLVLPAILFGMQIGIGLFMRVWFTPYMIVYLFWVPWGDVARWLAGRRKRPAAA
ncbi:MAG: putative rane protein [Phycisphaerales bacterium]|nr:putative rane protein [Phycisphaerales bacterium]